MPASWRCGRPTRSDESKIEWNQTKAGALQLDMANTLSTDFDLMRSVAATTDTRNEEIRTMLQAFIGRMGSVPPSVWSGPAAVRFKDVLDRWNAESMRLYRVLHTIAETIRHNEAALREAGENHAHHVAAAGGNL
jgi:WXG100 family type VII secretion target